jgi:transposase
MDHLIAGERNPKVLAQLARARARRKITELEQALEGAEFFTAGHAALLKTMLERIDRINEEIARLSEVIERLLAPWEEQLQQAGSMPGWGRRSAEDVLAETGPDMGKFPTGGHLVSWAGRAPLDKQSGKRQGRSRHKKGNKYVAAATGETATSAGKTDTREGARYRKLARSRGKAKAQVALGNTQLKASQLLADPGMRYADLGPDYYERQAAIRRKIAYHVREIEAHGLEVTLCRTPAPDPEPAGPGDTQAA